MEANVNGVSPEIHLFVNTMNVSPPSRVVCNAFALDVISVSAGVEGPRPITALTSVFFVHMHV